MGEAETFGIEEIIQTDWQSSEHSDAGLVPIDEYRAHRRRHGGGDTGFELRREQWRSLPVSN